MSAGEVDVHVGRRVRRRREALGLSQGRLGRHLGITFSQVQKYEKGTNRIGAGRLYCLAEVLDVPVQYFFEGLDGREASDVNSGQPSDEVDLSELDSAFVAIADPGTRQSVLALVCSLATPEAPARRLGHLTG